MSSLTLNANSGQILGTLVITDTDGTYIAKLTVRKNKPPVPEPDVNANAPPDLGTTSQESPPLPSPKAVQDWLAQLQPIGLAVMLRGAQADEESVPDFSDVAIVLAAISNELVGKHETGDRLT